MYSHTLRKIVKLNKIIKIVFTRITMKMKGSDFMTHKRYHPFSVVHFKHTRFTKFKCKSFLFFVMFHRKQYSNLYLHLNYPFLEAVDWPER